MKPEEFLKILAQAARLKITTRHCYTEEDRKESVADHSWRIALMAMLLTGVEEYCDFDMDKVIRMCLIHDLGESFTGDIPTFEKTGDVYKALDKLEALISHNESDINTWLPLEYDLQFTYGQENMKFSPYLKELRAAVDDWSREKIERES